MISQDNCNDSMRRVPCYPVILDFEIVRAWLLDDVGTAPFNLEVVMVVYRGHKSTVPLCMCAVHNI